MPECKADIGVAAFRSLTTLYHYLYATIPVEDLYRSLLLIKLQQLKQSLFT